MGLRSSGFWAKLSGEDCQVCIGCRFFGPMSACSKRCCQVPRARRVPVKAPLGAGASCGCARGVGSGPELANPYRTMNFSFVAGVELSCLLGAPQGWLDSPRF